MRRSTLPALGASLLLAGCVAPRSPAPVRAAPPPARPQPIAPPAPSAPLGWRDAPLTTGDWRWQPGRAAFVTQEGPVFTIACDAGSRRILLQAGAAPALTVDTTYASRALPVVGGSAALPASDPFLDQMAFSRGRIAVTPVGGARLILRSAPELARVIDDCRH